MSGYHPKVIEDSKRRIGSTPSGQPLIAWDEVYPDGSIKSFGEYWTVFISTSGIRYGLSVVLPIKDGEEKAKDVLNL